MSYKRKKNKNKNKKKKNNKKRIDYNNDYDFYNNDYDFYNDYDYNNNYNDDKDNTHLLINLVARGEIDKILSNQPPITFLKFIFSK